VEKKGYQDPVRKKCNGEESVHLQIKSFLDHHEDLSKLRRNSEYPNRRLLSNQGHRGKTATLRSIKSWLYWKYVEGNEREFCRMCLPCIGRLDSKVLRPVGQALHASRRNQLIHYDFLFSRNTEKFSYVLVPKDVLCSCESILFKKQWNCRKSQSRDHESFSKSRV
jgi:hypothetical protein